MTFTVTIDRDEDGAWVVECPSIPGCVSQGKTVDEAIENVKDAIKQCLEVRAEREVPSTAESSPVEMTPRLEKLRQARGMWKGRDDLPTLSELRKEWDRRAVDQEG
jgi:predicted RNase H-like HicB family nuclease